MLDNYKSLLAQTANEFPLIGQALIHHRNTRGKPMTFQSMPYLPQMYRDIPDLETVCIRKAVQTGLSELMICLSLYHAGWQGRIVAYVLPTFSVRDRFVSSRVNKVLHLTPTYKELLPRKTDVGNNRMKRFGSGSLLFLGSNTTGDFVEFSADTLIVDEVDQCDADNLAKAKDRIRASSSPKLFHLGNPTLPTVGISRMYAESDQRVWFQKCPHCGKWQNLDWFENFVRKNDQGAYIPRDKHAASQIDFRNIAHFKESVLPVCKYCERTFQIQQFGEWVPTYTERDQAGYSMSRLDIIAQSTSDLYVEWMLAQGNTSKLSTFYTSVLGMPFEYAGARITSQMIAETMQDYEIDYGGSEEYEKQIISMGVDVGSLLNVQVSTQYLNEDEEVCRKVILVMACRNFEELQDIIIRYHVDCCVIDSMPELRKCQELRDWAIDMGIAVWLARFYPTPKIGQAKYGRKLDWRNRIVTTDRTQIMDFTFDELRFQQKQYPSDVTSVLGFVEQMKAPVRVLSEEKSRIIWTEGSAADHFRFADVYDRIACDLASYGGSYSAV